MYLLFNNFKISYTFRISPSSGSTYIQMSTVEKIVLKMQILILANYLATYMNKNMLKMIV